MEWGDDDVFWDCWMQQVVETLRRSSTASEPVATEPVKTWSAATHCFEALRAGTLLQGSSPRDPEGPSQRGPSVRVLSESPLKGIPSKGPPREIPSKGLHLQGTHPRDPIQSPGDHLNERF